MYVLGRDKTLFPEPDVFCPDRWLSGDKRLDMFFKDVPFGFGPRMCLGKTIRLCIILSSHWFINMIYIYINVIVITKQTNKGSALIR